MKVDHQLSKDMLQLSITESPKVPVAMHPLAESHAVELPLDTIENILDRSIPTNNKDFTKTLCQLPSIYRHVRKHILQGNPNDNPSRIHTWPSFAKTRPKKLISLIVFGSNVNPDILKHALNYQDLAILRATSRNFRDLIDSSPAIRTKLAEAPNMIQKSLDYANRIQRCWDIVRRHDDFPEAARTIISSLNEEVRTSPYNFAFTADRQSRKYSLQNPHLPSRHPNGYMKRIEHKIEKFEKELGI